jgi:hypothetical protein
MLDLRLRKEFQGKRLKGTAIDLQKSAELPAAAHLEITYPSTDVLTAIEAIGPAQGRPVVLIGDRGQGKSHLMAVLHHALHEPAAARAWLGEWAARLGQPRIAALPLREPMLVITETLHRQSYRLLWDLLFQKHPHGAYIRGKWEGLGRKKSEVPSADLLMELFEHTPTALVLDEFQTWYDGLVDDAKSKPAAWAFTFIQLLSEIAEAHPERLLLVVSVRNGQNEAFKQLQRNHPRLVDFKSGRVRGDRLRLLLHRLFENRLNIPDAQIGAALDVHTSEQFRLRDTPGSEQEKVRQELIASWPFSPRLMELLEDQVLVATSAQETRDLIRVLADLFKRRGATSPVLTPADFHLDDEESGIVSLLDSLSNDLHSRLRQKAQRNLSAVAGAVSSRDVPHLSEIVGSLWLRSLAVGNLAGAEPRDLHLDITRGSKVDDNSFELELNTIVENSFNIHKEGAKLIFKEEENPLAKLLSHAKNDRLFAEGDKKGVDRTLLGKQVLYVLGGGEDAANRTFRIIALGRDWTRSPWEGVDESDHPDRWDDRIPVVVLPETPERLDSTLGIWLKERLTRRRNTVRFLLPRAGSTNLYEDRNLLVLARAVVLAAEWKRTDSAYAALFTNYQNQLRAILKKRFDRFAVLATWNYQNPGSCTFSVEALKKEGAEIPGAIDAQVKENLFIPEDFEELVLAAAQESQSVGKLLAELQEPRPNGAECIPWLGETQVKEKLVRLTAQGKVAINLRGMSILQRQEDETEEEAQRRMRGKVGTGRYLDETLIQVPQAVPTAGGGTPPTTNTGGSGGGRRGGQPPVEPEATPAEPRQETDEGADDDDYEGEEFDEDSIFDDERPSSTTRCSADSPTSALNLLAKVSEEWGISVGTKVNSVSLSIETLTGAQLNALLKALPPGTYKLDLVREDEG